MTRSSARSKKRFVGWEERVVAQEEDWVITKKDRGKKGKDGVERNPWFLCIPHVFSCIGAVTSMAVFNFFLKV